jgi:signal transduction histidine kinase
MQDSHKNNLLQLADYVASWLNRLYNTWKNRSEYDYIKKISSKEIYVQIWPK